MTIFEVRAYIDAYHERQKDKRRYEAILLSGLAAQVINAFSKNPKDLTLKKLHPDLFEEPNQNIPPERIEQAIAQSWKAFLDA